MYLPSQNLSVLKKMALIKLRKTSLHCYAHKYYPAAPHLKFACLPKRILLVNQHVLGTVSGNWFYVQIQ